MKSEFVRSATLRCIESDIHNAFCFAHDLLCKWHIDYIDSDLARKICLDLINLEDDFYFRNNLKDKDQ